MSENQKPSNSSELQSHIRQTVVGLVVFFLVMGVLGFALEPQIEALTQTIHQVVGPPGLALFVFITDALVSPIPPDVALVIVSRTELRETWKSVVLLLGVASCIAGPAGWWIGSKLRRSSIPKWIFGDKLAQGEKLMQRWGALSVAIGALTPIPYSLTTWTAGILGFPLRRMWLPCLLRVPRFYVYYLVLTKALDWGALLRGG